jgi:hypothetical protein
MTEPHRIPIRRDRLLHRTNNTSAAAPEADARNGHMPGPTHKGCPTQPAPWAMEQPPNMTWGAKPPKSSVAAIILRAGLPPL